MHCSSVYLAGLQLVGRNTFFFPRFFFPPHAHAFRRAVCLLAQQAFVVGVGELATTSCLRWFHGRRKAVRQPNPCANSLEGPIRGPTLFSRECPQPPQESRNNQVRDAKGDAHELPPRDLCAARALNHRPESAQKKGTGTYPGDGLGPPLHFAIPLELCD